MGLPRIAIPSLNRQTIISHLTLKYLSDMGYPHHLIDIFVASDNQKADYLLHVSPLLYGQIIVGELGLASQRNFISHYYPDNQIYVSMDDDVRSLIFMTPSMSFCGFITFCVQELEKGEAGLMGVMPNSDTRRFKTRITEHLTHILGSFFVIRNHHDLFITVEEKEDYQRSILYYYRYGRVLRYGMAGVDTRYAQTPGGLQQDGRMVRMREGVNYLVNTYPDVVIRKDKRGLPDIQLNWRHRFSNVTTDNGPGTSPDRGTEQITNPNQQVPSEGR